MKRINILASILPLIFCACSNPKDNNKPTNDDINIVYDLENTTNIVEQSDTRFEYAKSFNKTKYFFFNIGTIQNVPFYSSMSFMYGDFDYDVDLSFSKITQSSISSTIINTTEVVTGFENYLSWEVGGGITFGIDNLLGINFSTDISNTDHTYFEEKAITSYQRTQDYLEQYSEGFTIKVPINTNNGFIRNRKYKVCFYETFTVYGVVIYNPDATFNEQFSYSTLSLLGTDEISLYIEQSDCDGNFKYGHDGRITFNKEYAKKYAETSIASEQPMGLRNKGTKEDPYEILNEIDFLDFTSPQFNKPNVYGKLMADLDFTHFSTDSCSTLNSNLDGNGHKIMNKLITDGSVIRNNYRSILCYGLFEAVSESGSISNLVIENLQITDSLNDDKLYCDGVYVGLICGLNFGTIVNCSSNGIKKNGNISFTVDTSKSIDYVIGAICGLNENTIERCDFSKISISLFIDNRNSSLKNIQSGVMVGGLVGFHSEGDVSFCSISQFFISINVLTVNERFRRNAGLLCGEIVKSSAYVSSNEIVGLIEGSMFYFVLYSDYTTRISAIDVKFNNIGALY